MIVAVLVMSGKRYVGRISINFLTEGVSEMRPFFCRQGGEGGVEEMG